MTETILIISISVYAIRSIIFLIGAYIERVKNGHTQKSVLPFVSVVIPARNEEKNIARCLDSLVLSTYPRELHEIIVVNDRSSDNTGSILSEYAGKFDNIKIINVAQDEPTGNLKGKPGALQRGIDSAIGTIILMTDADCSLHPDWIFSIVNAFDDPDVGIVAGYTTIDPGNLFEGIQAVEWGMTHTMASAGIAFNKPLGCFGNNLSVRTEIFRKLGGYRKIRFSVTEDLALLQAVVNTGKKARYIASPSSVVTTLPCETFQGFVRQHKRWAIGGIDLGWKAFVFVAATIIFWVGVVLSIITGNYVAAAGFLLVRILLDHLLLIPAFRTIGKSDLIKWIIPSSLILTFWEIIIPFLIIDKKVIWKGQEFKRTSI